MKSFILSIAILISSFINLNAQILKTEADTLSLLLEIPYPEASATMIFGFNVSMLNIYKLPEKKKGTEALADLLKKYESDKKNIRLLMDIYYAYNAQNEQGMGMPYLEKAYGQAMELYELNPSNLEVVDQISDMLLAVNRMPDVPALWKDYTDRNPMVAMGWAKLATYQAQNMDMENCRKSVEMAFELDPELPDLYVAALSDVIYRLILKLQQEGENAEVKADLTFFEKALAKQPESDFVKMGYNTAKLFELFYGVIIANASNDDSKAFKMVLNDQQKVQLAELEKSFKAMLDNKKIVNKYMALKSLLVLEVLKSEPEMGLAYLEEAKKIIDNDADLYRMISFAYIIQKKYDKSTGYLKKSTEISPNFNDLFALSRIYFENHETGKSLDVLEAMLPNNPGNTDIIMGIISNQIKEKKFQDACSTLFRLESMYKEDRDLENNDPYFLFYKAVCTLVYSKNPDEVKKALQAVIDKKLPWSEEAENLLKKFF